MFVTTCKKSSLEDAGRIIDAYEVYYRLRGNKVARLANTRREAFQLKKKIKNEKRKFLGFRKVTLQEI
jgi:hypothetical protein